MATIDVSPAGLREAGGNLNGTRERLVTDSNVHMLHGVGDDRHISTGGFAPGVWSQELLTRHYQRAQEVFRTVNQNLIALSSALYIVADVFDSADQKSALEFAFLSPNAQVPAGLPGYIDPKVTSEQLRAQAAAATAANGGILPEGYTQRHVVTNPYTTKVEILDADGNVVATRSTTSIGGATTTTILGPDLQVIGSRVHESTRYGEATRTYSGMPTQENLIRARHKVTYPDGTTRYYTDDYTGQGEPERTDEMTVAPEPAPMAPGESFSRSLDELENQAERDAFEQEVGLNFSGPFNHYTLPISSNQ